MNAAMGLTAAILLATPLPASAGDWAPAWMASPQPVWSSDFLFPTDVPVTLKDRTLRQVARIGIGGNAVAEEATPELYLDVMNVNLCGAIRCLKHVLPGMREDLRERHFEESCRDARDACHGSCRA